MLLREFNWKKSKICSHCEKDLTASFKALGDDAFVLHENLHFKTDVEALELFVYRLLMKNPSLIIEIEDEDFDTFVSPVKERVESICEDLFMRLREICPSPEKAGEEAHRLKSLPADIREKEIQKLIKRKS